MANRFTDPSAGAFSYHTGFYYKATRTIIAGEELFAHYGKIYDKKGIHTCHDHG